MSCFSASFVRTAFCASSSFCLSEAFSFSRLDIFCSISVERNSWCSFATATWCVLLALSTSWCSMSFLSEECAAMTSSALRELSFFSKSRHSSSESAWATWTCVSPGPVMMRYFDGETPNVKFLQKSLYAYRSPMKAPVAFMRCHSLLARSSGRSSNSSFERNGIAA